MEGLETEGESLKDFEETAEDARERIYNLIALPPFPLDLMQHNRFLFFQFLHKEGQELSSF